MVTCPVCGRSLGLADRNGRHVASDAHYPHRDASGKMVCSPVVHTGWVSQRTKAADSSPCPEADHR